MEQYYSTQCTSIRGATFQTLLDCFREEEAYSREEASGGDVGLHNDVLVELLGLEADRLIERGALVVVEVHGDVHTVAEEVGPHLGLPVVQVLWAGLEQGLEEVSVPVLVLHSISLFCAGLIDNLQNINCVFLVGCM